ncbi:hypothetical protein CRENBAI_003162 [Crenichthys baileyi]|uniref:Uncharacterized protein n=1 Tax=Crenichthys baileyi TaxID=28760 RepID=A0AAV9S024_9TELE
MLRFVLKQKHEEDLAAAIDKWERVLAASDRENQKIQRAQKQADLSRRPLEDELQALTDRLEKIQAQLNSVLSDPDVEQTAVAELTSKVKGKFNKQEQQRKKLPTVVETDTSTVKKSPDDMDKV